MEQNYERFSILANHVVNHRLGVDDGIWEFKVCKACNCMKSRQVQSWVNSNLCLIDATLLRNFNEGNLTNIF